jgi:hypothetical protein
MESESWISKNKRPRYKPLAFIFDILFVVQWYALRDTTCFLKPALLRAHVQHML